MQINNVVIDYVLLHNTSSALRSELLLGLKTWRIFECVLFPPHLLPYYVSDILQKMCFVTKFVSCRITHVEYVPNACTPSGSLLCI